MKPEVNQIYFHKVHNVYFTVTEVSDKIRGRSVDLDGTPNEAWAKGVLCVLSSSDILSDNYILQEKIRAQVTSKPRLALIE